MFTNTSHKSDPYGYPGYKSQFEIAKTLLFNIWHKARETTTKMIMMMTIIIIII